jgi:hypothetical protein
MVERSDRHAWLRRWRLKPAPLEPQLIVVNVHTHLRMKKSLRYVKSKRLVSDLFTSMRTLSNVQYISQFNRTCEHKSPANNNG